MTCIIHNSYDIIIPSLLDGSPDLQESFQGPTVSVPDLEGALYLKESGKKAWKRRYFVLRASGIYYVQKGKTKVRATCQRLKP